MTDRMLQIGEVADRVGLSLRSVRFYEEQGLLTPAARSAGGFRLYTERQVERLALIKRMKPLGFTVEQMAELLAAHDRLRDPATQAADRAAARRQLETFAHLAAERCEQLRRQLDHAEAFARQLQDATADAARGSRSTTSAG